MNRMTIVSLSALTAAAAVLLSACAPASLGSPPANERHRNCVSGETLVCRDRQPSRLDKDEDQFCTCEPLDSGLRY